MINSVFEKIQHMKTCYTIFRISIFYMLIQLHRAYENFSKDVFFVLKYLKKKDLIVWELIRPWGQHMKLTAPHF